MAAGSRSLDAWAYLMIWDSLQEKRLESGLAELYCRMKNSNSLYPWQRAIVEDRILHQEISHYGKILLQWHDAFHLLGEQKEEDFVSLHLLDSISGALFLQAVVSKTIAQIVDVGSGLGLPGLPLALCFADAECILIEPASRRANILRSMIAELGLQGRVEVFEYPVEQWNRSSCPGLRIVTCRAFRALGKSGGRSGKKAWGLLQRPTKGAAASGILLYKGKWDTARREIESLELRPQAESLFPLPQCGHQRSLFYLNSH